MADIKYKSDGMEIVGNIQASGFLKTDGTNAIPSKTSDLTNDSEFITNATVGDVATLLTAAKGSTVSAINELFTSASNGKTQIATAVTGKGVSASGSDTFTTLATKIGQIATGKRWAHGSVNSGSTPTSGKYPVTASGLSFRPSVIVTAYSTSLNEGSIYAMGAALGRVDNFVRSIEGGSTDVSPVTITDTGFTVGVARLNNLYYWVAFE